MRVSKGLAAATLAFAALMWSGTEAVAQECNRGGKHTIQVMPADDGSAELRYRDGPGDSVTVCRGDTVTWVLLGSDRTFFVDFLSGVPFDGAARRGYNSRLTVTIDAARGSYSYDVGFDGDPGVDPIIIVE
jgi:plastocyanin